MAAEHTPRREKTTEPWGRWEPSDPQHGAAAFRRLADSQPDHFAGAALAGSRSSPLSFYNAHRLMELTIARDSRTARVFVLDSTRGTFWLNGDAGVLHEANAAETLALTAKNVTDYVHFFLYFLRHEGSAFVLIESEDEIGKAAAADARGPAGGSAATTEEDQPLDLQTARDHARALSAEGPDQAGRWLFDVTLAYQGMLFSSSLAVSASGLVEMTDDEVIGSLSGLEVPEVPHLGPMPAVAGSAAQRPVADRDVTKAVVSVLLEDAIRDMNRQARAGTALLHHFNSQTHTQQPIGQLAQLIAESKAMVIIESDIPFVEDVVAELVAPHEASGPATRATAVRGDDGCCEITVHPRSKLFLLSFHTYRSLFDAERATHDLALSERAVFIGCDRAEDVPEPLRRTADLVITFPQINKSRFARIVEQVFRAQPPDGWDVPNADWTQYLVPNDFHTPRRLSLSADRAVSMLRDRVQARLSSVAPDVGPGIDQLHGMGEARQVAEDLIEDIRAAQSGQIPWSAVDRGLLLTGAPGTGKTTLARAVAKECGVKFVAETATNWQSAGPLPAHLRAIRAAFASARRYAPAILFIDEIDSIGNREHLVGPNAQYQTEVINALLAEIQGIDTAGSVIVIGATNYVDKVDPALRRAGRLDQVVEIPLPSVDALEQIFAYYVSEFEAAGGDVGADIDRRALAEMSFGTTGADVEFFVRGGARRARREQRPVRQADLMAEVTRRPRRPDSAPPLTGLHLRRVAVHEAGHAVAQLTNSTRGADLTFVSVIPRLDGSLGFTASAPTDTRVMTRRSMVERLETMLGGRAAEEVVFGADDIGAGAGGPSASSDLAVATRLATLVVCQSGLGADGMLRWTAQPTAEQSDEVDDILNAAYRNIRAKLQAQRTLLEDVAASLEQHQELSGHQLRKLTESLGRPAD